jgi:hypothetical protein
MPGIKEITRAQAFTAIKTGEFGADITRSGNNVAVLMTQDWCPRWADMKRWFYSLEGDFHVYVLIYNKEDYFEEFRHFKESVWKNDRIPYVRYYSGGVLTSDSNHVTRDEFMKRLGMLPC